MMKNIAIKLHQVSKKYSLHHEKPTLVESIFSSKHTEEFWALKKINLTIQKGERLGVIGPNGSGKTTLLEIIAGITTPTTGTIEVHGKIVSLIDLSAGFQPDLTGEENILLNGLLIGMSKDEVKEKLQNIIDFAELGHFIDAPFYTYSSGMALRLGFSIIVHAKPDILLLDENLGVGDEAFRKKSRRKIQSFLQQGNTIIIVSHWTDFLRENCQRLIWIDKGKTIMDDSPKKVLNRYIKK